MYITNKCFSAADYEEFTVVHIQTNCLLQDTGPTFLSDADFSLEKYPVFKYERKSIVDYPGNNVNKSIRDHYMQISVRG